MGDRKVVQIAVCATETESGAREEGLYALDSDGTIWQWVDANAVYSAGWSEMAAPWDKRSVRHAPPKP